MQQSRPLITSVLRLRDELVAFSIDEIVANDFAIGHFGNARRSVPKSSIYLHIHVLRILNKRGVHWLNDEQDLGYQGLRYHKLLREPARFIKKYSIAIRE